LAVLLAASPAPAQVATGRLPFGSFGGGPFDTVDLANLDVHFQIPVINKAGRGLPFDYILSYDNSVWYPSSVSGQTTWTQVSNWGWTNLSQGLPGTLTYHAISGRCMTSNGWVYYPEYLFGPYVDAANVSHNAIALTTPGSTTCGVAPITSASGTATDGSGYTVVVTNYTSYAVYSRSGVNLDPPLSTSSSSASTVTDPNGNKVSSSTSSGTTTYTDTLGTTALTVSGSGTPSSPIALKYYAPSGSKVPVKVKYTAYTVQTNFGCSGITEFGATQEYLVSEIDLPDNTSSNSDKYLFTYEVTPGDTHSPHYVTGRLASVTLPTGGTITYQYSGGSNGITCTDGSTAWLERYTPDTGSNYWQYCHYESGSAWTTYVTDPAGNEAVYNFQGPFETERQVYQGSSSSGTLLETAVTCYNGASSNCNTTAITLPITQRTVTTTLGSEVAQANTYYNNYSLVTKNDEYDFGNGTVGAFKRETMICYASLSNAYIQDRPQYALVYSATGNASDCSGTSGLVAETAYTYDGKGNLKTETHTNTQGSPSSITRKFTYGSYGVLQTSTDFDGNKTTYTNTACNNLFPTQITPPITSLPVWLTWDTNCYGAVITSVTDPSLQTTTYVYGDPNFWRVTEIDYPDTGKTTFGYTDAANNFSVATSRLVNSTLGYHTVTQYLDGLGRANGTVDSQACNGAGGTATVAYDSLGRAYQVSNPYCTTSDPTYGLTTYGYDGLSRVNSITYPDTGATSISYSGNCSTAKDPASKQRTLCSDALGRVTSVAEDPGGLNYQTTYTYDDLDDLTGVAQGSSQTRTYTYDMLARLTSAKTPEVNVGGTQCSTTYGYDANGNLTSKTAPLENQTSCSSTITTTYAYDQLNRLTSKTYSDSTPAANFFYDQAPGFWPAWSGVSFSNPEGRLVLACTSSPAGTCLSPATATAYSYDPVGRTNSFWQCNPSNCGSSSIWNTQYNYDLAGDITSWIHPSGYTLTNTVNSAQQVTAVQSSWQDSSHPQYLAQNVTYTAWGAVSQLQNGCVGSGCVNAQETYQYNNRLQPVMIELGTGGSSGNPSAYSCLVYNYYSDVSNPASCATPSQGTRNNGNVMGYLYQDSVNSSFSHTASYTYDGVNRLSTAAATGNSTYNLAFSYDAYGNMSCTTNGQTQGYCPNWTFNPSSNQLTTSGFTYDAAGNLTTDASNMPAHTYQWDAEGRVASVDSGSAWGFTYNAVGQRVQWAYSGGAYQLLFDPYGGWLGIDGAYSLVRRGDGFLAVYTGSETHLHHINHLGSTTGMTDHAGTAVEDIVFYPWGDVWQYWGGGGFNFATMPYDETITDTNLTMFRLQSPNLGRWHSPDPLGGSVTNPQSLNRYVYVMNNPTSLVDPWGLCDPQSGMPCHPVNEPASNDPFAAAGWDPLDLLISGASSSEATITYEYEAEEIPPDLVQVVITSGDSIIDYYSTINVTVAEVETGVVINAPTNEFAPLAISLGQAGQTISGAYGTALGALGKVFRGRPPGQSFGACVANNMSLMGVDPRKALNVGNQLSLVVTAAVSTSPAQWTTPGGGLVGGMLASGIGTNLGSAIGLGSFGATMLGRLAAGGAVGVAVAADALISLTAGSAINCASEGVAP
jgi:RHS repeat-associated protein